jgi:acetylornithine deacetylase/succinyl-diaminopimelate desuccinylase-like protein
MHSVTDPLRYARQSRRRFLAELAEFIRFPSVSAQPKHAADMRNCAAWLAGHLRKIGLERVAVTGTAGHPVVHAEWWGNRSLPTLLIYGHYDVQPPEPLDQWRSPPFVPVVRGENIYGRGASDDKGQMFAHVKALESCLRTMGKLPVNVKCIFEGEEEIGSPGLERFLAMNKEHLHADGAVVSDMPMPAPGRPAITYAMRGGLSLELEVRGPERDLHSGLYGGAVHNPVQALVGILSGLHDRSGRIVIPRFYDRVRRWSDAERQRMRRAGPGDAEIVKQARARRLWGEKGYTGYERLTIRPALTINGIKGGYQGPGSKGVIPASASAKLSFRLAPDQDPFEVEQQARQYIARLTPPAVTSHVRVQSHARPVVSDIENPAMRAAAFALQKGFGTAPVFLRCGGTIPVVDTFRRLLNIPTVLMGFALPDDRMHAPNEKFHLPNFYSGIESSIWFLHALERLSKQSVSKKEERDANDYRLPLSRR